MSNLFRVGLENAAAATLLAIAAFAASRFLKRSPALVHAFLLLVLLKLVTPPLWSVPVIFDPVPPAPETWATVEARPDLILFDSPSLALAEPAVMVPEIAKVAPLDFVQTIDMESEPEVTLALSGSPEPRDANAATLPVIDWGQAFGVIWLVGSAVTLVVSVLAIRRFVRVLALAKPASPTVELHVEEAAARIGLARIPETFLIDWDRPPMVWAMGRRPSLMIPTALWARLDPGQRDTLLIHELAHLKRGDHLVRWLELAVSVLFWWLPVVWWTRRALRETEEDCCDAWVIWALPKSARCYADTLVETVDFLSESRTQAPLLASGFGHVRHLKRRLKMIMQGNTTRRLRLREGLAILAMGVAFLPLNPSLAEPPAPAADVKGETTVTTDVHTDVDKETGKTITITKTVTTTTDDEGRDVTLVEQVEPPAPPVTPAAPAPPAPIAAPVPPAPPVPPVASAPPTVRFFATDAKTVRGTPVVVSEAVGMRGGIITADEVIAGTVRRLENQVKLLTNYPEEKNKDRQERRVKALKQAIEALQNALNEPQPETKMERQARVVIERRLGKMDSSRTVAKDGGADGDVITEVRDVEVLTEDVRGGDSGAETAVARGQQLKTLNEKLKVARRLARDGSDPTVQALQQQVKQLTDELNHRQSSKLAESDKLKHQEDRLSAMEKTLAKVLEELKSLKKEKSN